MYQGPYLHCPQETDFRATDTYRLKGKGRKKRFHKNENKQKAGVAMLMPDKIDMKTKFAERAQQTLAECTGLSLLTPPHNPRGY